MDRVGQIPDRHLSDEQRMMRETCERYVDAVLRPFIADNREREWTFADPAHRLPPEILEEADKAGIRTLGVPEEHGGISLEPATEAQTFSIIATEISRGDTGLADKLVQNWKIAILLRELAPKHLQDEIFAANMADPQYLMAHCLTEPRGASDRWLYENVPRNIFVADPSGDPQVGEAPHVAVEKGLLGLVAIPLSAGRLTDISRITGR